MSIVHSFLRSFMLYIHLLKKINLHMKLQIHHSLTYLKLRNVAITHET